MLQCFPVRPGDTGDDVRAAFLGAVAELAAWQAGEPEPEIELRGYRCGVTRVFGMMIRCHEPLPDDAARQVRVLVAEGDTATWASAAVALLRHPKLRTSAA